MTQRERDRLVALNKAGKKLLTPKQAAQCRSPHAVQPQELETVPDFHGPSRPLRLRRPRSPR